MNTVFAPAIRSNAIPLHSTEGNKTTLLFI